MKTSGPVFPFNGRICPDCDRYMEDDEAALVHREATGHSFAWTAIGWCFDFEIVFGETETWRVDNPNV